MSEKRKNEQIPQELEASVKEDGTELSDEALSSAAGGERWWEWGGATNMPQTDTQREATNAADTGHHYPGI